MVQKALVNNPQHPFLFNISVRDNLLWANNHASESEIDHACKLANAYDFIQELEMKYDTIVGEKGVRLSGGQAQRIVLARSLYKMPNILLLDEATNALDIHTEKKVFSAIFKKFKNLT